MNPRENLLSLLRRTGYEKAPVDMDMCPSLEKDFREETGTTLPLEDYFDFPVRSVKDGKIKSTNTSIAKSYFKDDLHPKTYFDMWGVAHEPGSEKAMHMTRMHHPLKNMTSLDELQSYPFPDFINADYSHQKNEVINIQTKGYAAGAQMACTIWETAWYMRSMEALMGDMMDEDPMAEWLLDEITNRSVLRAEAFAKAGVDCLFLGDDIGMQHSIMMSRELYNTYLQPRLKRVIQAAKAIKPDLIVLYHSCGYVTPFIPDLLDAGIDVLNPVQPECMDFGELHAEFGNVLSFHGTLGTQTTMPFGTPNEVKEVVEKNLKIAGNKGGLWVAPTHILEPEVPFANVKAYVDACKNWK